eukprot:1184447-Prorocentrum_minimum.AAC.2
MHRHHDADHDTDHDADHDAIPYTFVFNLPVVGLGCCEQQRRVEPAAGRQVIDHLVRLVQAVHLQEGRGGQGRVGVTECAPPPGERREPKGGEREGLGRRV